MKKLLLALAFLSLFALSFITRVNAQKFKTSSKFDNKTLKASVSRHDNPEDKKAYDAENISPRAIKDFKKSYKGISGETWSQSVDGFLATFTQNGIRHMIYYDTKGRWHGSLRYLTEKLLPGDVRHLVKSTYYDFYITHVAEVQVGRKTAYLVTVDNETSWKVIRVIDGEMDEKESYIKRR